MSITVTPEERSVGDSTPSPAASDCGTNASIDTPVRSTQAVRFWIAERAPQADLAVTKTDGVTTATPGGSVTYTITASNAGPSNAPGSSVARATIASVPSVTVWGPL